MDVIEVTFPVRYVECDPLGVAHHSSYVVWFEVVRGEYMRRHPEKYAELDRQGAFLPIAEMRVRYRAPARHGDEITVRSWIAELKSRRVTFAHEVRRAGDGQVLAEGETAHICLDLETGALRTIPPKVREGLRPYLRGKGEKAEREKGKMGREGRRDVMPKT